MIATPHDRKRTIAKPMVLVLQPGVLRTQHGRGIVGAAQLLLHMLARALVGSTSRVQPDTRHLFVVGAGGVKPLRAQLSIDLDTHLLPLLLQLLCR